MYDFKTGWSNQIADITGSAEYLTAVIQLRDPSLVTDTYNVDTGVHTTTGDPTVWYGNARVTPIRAASEYAGTSTGNPTNIVAMRVQIPYDAYPDRVKTGWQVRVVTAPRNPALTTLVLTVESDVQGSSAATRTLHCTVNTEVNAGWSDLFPVDPVGYGHGGYGQ